MPNDEELPNNEEQFEQRTEAYMRCHNLDHPEAQYMAIIEVARQLAIMNALIMEVINAK